MTRKIKYKPISQELEKIAKPVESSSARPSVGLEEAVGEFFFISTDRLIPFKNQARKEFSEEEIVELASSIKEYGVRQPLTVLKTDDGKYEVVSGERRLRAAKSIGLHKVPCILLKNSSDADAVALIENIHRKDLHPIELGIIYKKLLEQGIFSSQIDLADKISVSKGKVSEYLKYADIPEDIQNHILSHKITAREKLRDIVKAHEAKDYEKMNFILGLSKRQQSNFSILRVSMQKGRMVFQDSGIQKLSDYDKKNLQQYLVQLLDVVSEKN